MRKLLVLSLVLFSSLGLTSCKPSSSDSIKVGTIDGPETQLMEAAKDVAKKKYGLNVNIVTFSDYNTPNAALNDGSIDANAFQTQPFLDAQEKEYGYKFTVAGKTFIYPVGIYSKKYKNLDQLPRNAKVAIPMTPVMKRALYCY
jgi:D-methionine transport system substrate-binding protein